MLIMCIPCPINPTLPSTASTRLASSALFPNSITGNAVFQQLRPNSLDSCLYLTPHIQSVMIFCWLYLQNISRISPLFTTTHCYHPGQRDHQLSCGPWQQHRQSSCFHPCFPIFYYQLNSQAKPFKNKPHCYTPLLKTLKELPILFRIKAHIHAIAQKALSR